MADNIYNFETPGRSDSKANGSPSDMNQLGSRVPPHSKEAEVAVIGAMMLDRQAIAKVISSSFSVNYFIMNPCNPSTIVPLINTSEIETIFKALNLSYSPLKFKLEFDIFSRVFSMSLKAVSSSP